MSGRVGYGSFIKDSDSNKTEHENSSLLATSLQVNNFEGALQVNNFEGNLIAQR